MGLSSELASQFAKVTNDSSRNTNGTKLYGTITMLGEVPHVKLDGTEELTPISRTVEVAEGDRVEVMIANHSATVTGNLTDPSIGVVRAGNLESKITQTAEQIQLQVSDLEKNLDSKITQTATEIRSEVSDLDGRFSENITTVENGIREDLTNSLASMSETLTQVETSIRDDLGAEISGLGEDLSGLEESTNSSISTINASIETLTFNVSDLDSKITQTAAEIRSEVSAEVTDLNATIVNTETGIRDTINVEVANLDSKITQTATSIQSEVSAKFKTVDGEIEKFSKFKQTVEGFSFMGNGGTVKINGGDINLTGAISFSDLSDATSKQQEINAISSTASSALSTANSAASTASSALSAANSAANAASSAQSVAKSIANGSYLKGTFINGKKISSPEIEGNNIKVYGTFQTIGHDGASQVTTGYMGAAMGKDGYGNDTIGVALSNSWNPSNGTIGTNYVIVTNAGARMQSGNNRVIVTDEGIYINTAGSYKAYYNGKEIGSGSASTVTAVWG